RRGQARQPRAQGRDHGAGGAVVVALTTTGQGPAIAGPFHLHPGAPPYPSDQRRRSAVAKSDKARVVGFNHVALEVGDIEEALAFYGRLFEFKLRGKSKTMAFIDLGDQFIALQKGRKQAPDDGRHFGLVVDDKETARRALKAAKVKVLPGRFLDFRDPW